MRNSFKTIDADIFIAGSAFTTGGTSYDYKTFIMEAAGKYDPESWKTLEATDGDNTVRVDLILKHNSAVDQMLKLILVNARSAL